MKAVIALGVFEFSGDAAIALHPLRLERGAVPGSAGVPPASSDFRLPAGRRDAGAPKRFMEWPEAG
jgi:hypothetical protein